jgi:Lipase (class 3)
LRNIETLLQPDFPLEGYAALRGAVVISHFKGRIANLPGYVVYRPSTKQLIVGLSGTSSMKLAFHDVRTLQRRHPSGRGKVHAGFWSLYEGVKPAVLEAIATGLKEHDVKEIALTGHSMGGSVLYLLAIDLLTAGSAKNAPLPSSFKIAVFGTPRAGCPALVKYWWELVDTFRNVHGQDALKEYSVKAYNDGRCLLSREQRIEANDAFKGYILSHPTPLDIGILPESLCISTRGSYITFHVRHRKMRCSLSHF